MTDPIIDFDDYDSTRKRLMDGVATEIALAFPIENDRFRVELSDVGYDNPHEYSLADQKDAILRNKDLTWRLTGTWSLVDKHANKVLGSRRDTLAHVPYITPRGTAIRRGTEYVFAKQARLRPGVFARRKESGELESHFNVQAGSGSSFKVMLEPESGKFKLLAGQASIPLFDVLKRIGVDEASMAQAWGRDLLNLNKSGRAIDINSKLQTHFGNKRIDPSAMTESQRTAYYASLFDRMRLDPDVTSTTLGKAYDRVSPEVLLAATQKLLRIHKAEADTDDRDSTAFQTIHELDDILREKIRRDAGGVVRRAMWKATAKGGSLNPFTSGLFDAHIDAVMSSGLANPLEEINPIELADQNRRIIRLGEGAIPSADAVPDEARAVQPTQFLYIDPIKTPESNKAGVDLRLAYKTARRGRTLVTPVLTPDGKLTYESPETVTRSVVAFPGDIADSSRKLVRAMDNGKLRYVKRSEVKFIAPSDEASYALTSNMIPAMSGIKGHRLLMGSKMLTQALPLREPEAPYVQSATPDDRNTSFDKLAGRFAGAVFADGKGVVTRVTPDEVRVRYDDGTVKTHQLYNNFAWNRKTFIHNTPLVQPGTSVNPGQPLARSNFTTEDGTTAIGRNLLVAYMPYNGLNYEDSAVISESAAKKLSSEHMYQKALDSTDDEVDFGKKPFTAIYPSKFTHAQLSRLDDEGVIKPGSKIQSGDPLILGLGRPTPSGASVSRRAKRFAPPDRTVTWDHDVEGTVTDVVRTKNGWQVTVKAYSPSIVGDKLAGRYGDKSVLAAIVPDNQMLKTADGETIDIVVNPLGLNSRINPSQITEALLGKVAHKRKKPYLVSGFSPTSNLEFAESELSKHQIKANEDLFDPQRNRTIPGILVGRRFYMKLHHMAAPKEHGRGAVGDEGVSYTSDKLPARGGTTGAKRLSVQDVNALVANSAYETIRDAHLIRGQRNDEYWKALRLGNQLPTPRGGFVNDKFFELLRGAGINTKKSGNFIHAMALTDRDISELSRGELANPSTVDLKTLDPLPGGLFDVATTGGHDGRGWKHITLAEPMPNPVMEEPIRRLLGLTRKELEDVIGGKHTLHNQTGPRALYDALSRLNVDKEIQKARDDIQSGKATRRDAAVKRLGYLTTMKKQGYAPVDMMWTKLPVLPPAFRPIVRLNSDVVTAADANGLYRDAFQANKILTKLKTSLDDSQLGDERLTLLRSIRAVAGLGDPVSSKSQDQKLKGLLNNVFGSSPKYGIVQRQLISRPQDTTGRAVISVDPSLDLDEVGVPEDMAWNMYSPFVVRRLIRRGAAATVAATETDRRTPLARQILLEEMEHRPVTINRAPTLHRFSIQGAWPVLTTGSTIRIPPMLTPGFGADFDGDQMNLYVPVSEESRKEVIDRLLPSRNLLDSTRFEVHFMPRQEFLWGLSVASGAAGKRSSAPPRTFATSKDALNAFRRGELRPTDAVRIMEKLR